MLGVEDTSTSGEAGAQEDMQEDGRVDEDMPICSQSDPCTQPSKPPPQSEAEDTVKQPPQHVAADHGQDSAHVLPMQGVISPTEPLQEDSQPHPHPTVASKRPLDDTMGKTVVASTAEMLSPQRAAQQKGNKRVRISNARVTKFSLAQGGDTLPNEGGPSLALGRPVCGQDKCVGCEECTDYDALSPDNDDDGASGGDGTSGVVRRRHPAKQPSEQLARVPPSDRAAWLEAEGTPIDEDILRENAVIWRLLNTSRRFCGCTSQCRPASCGCSQRGVECWVDTDQQSGCGCAPSALCRNPAGRYSFSQHSVNQHRRERLSMANGEPLVDFTSMQDVSVAAVLSTPQRRPTRATAAAAAAAGLVDGSSSSTLGTGSNRSSRSSSRSATPTPAPSPSAAHQHQPQPQPQPQQQPRTQPQPLLTRKPTGRGMSSVDASRLGARRRIGGATARQATAAAGQDAPVVAAAAPAAPSAAQVPAPSDHTAVTSAAPLTEVQLRAEVPVAAPVTIITCAPSCTPAERAATPLAHTQEASMATTNTQNPMSLQLPATKTKKSRRTSTSRRSHSSSVHLPTLGTPTRAMAAIAVSAETGGSGSTS